jgi:hypothetical protein
MPSRTDIEEARWANGPISPLSKLSRRPTSFSGVLLTLAVVKGLAEAGNGLLDSVRVRNDTNALILAIDRMLLVLMIVRSCTQ